jgi:hypothetical protein
MGTLKELTQIFDNELRRKEISTGDIKNFLSELKREGMIAPIRKGPNAPWKFIE